MQEAPRARGRLRVYLGAAPGVGKTYAMLGEGHRRRLERGTDVVVGLVETHGREHTAEMLAGLEVVPGASLEHRGAAFEEMDVDAVLRAAPGGRPGRRARAHQRAGLAPRQAVAGRRGPARRRHRRHHDGQHPAPRVGQRRGREDHRRPAARDGPRRRGAGGRPDRARATCPARRCGATGARQRLRRRRRSTPRWATTSASATSPRCASSRCCGRPTRSTTRWRPTATSTRSPAPGRRASGSSSRSRADRRARP